MHMEKSVRAVVAFISGCSLLLMVSATAGQKLLEKASSPPSSSSSLDKEFGTTYVHTWPAMKFGWRIVAGTLIAFCGAAFGSGGIGGGGVFVPMLTLIVGFDTKSSAAVSKCMIVGAAGSTVYYNIRQRHPTLDMPVIDYDLALLFQPMLVLGISTGVTLNVVLADWTVTALLILLCFVTSSLAIWKGLKTWKKETIQKVANRGLITAEQNVNRGEHKAGGESLSGRVNKRSKVSVMKNVHWKKVGIMFSVWIAILAIQIVKSYTNTCSTMYWFVDLLQIPVTVGASGFEVVMLYKGNQVIASRGEAGANFKFPQLVSFCLGGVMTGLIGGLVGLGGGIILGPLFLMMGIPPQVSSATATFAMLFSSSMSVVEYYLLKRFPIPYTLYFVSMTTIAALMGQYVVKKVINVLGRASIIIFVLATLIFFSTIFIGFQGTVNITRKLKNHEYLWFESLCSNHP